MSRIWRRTHMNPYVNEEMAWQRIQDLLREAESRRALAAAGAQPVEVAALAWIKRHVARLASSAWNGPRRRMQNFEARPVAAQLVALDSADCPECDSCEQIA
jgi:hypothetical protein